MDNLEEYLKQPLVWTTKGNLPASSLKIIPRWIDEPKAVQLVVEYHDDKDEIVRQDVFNYLRAL